MEEVTQRPEQKIGRGMKYLVSRLEVQRLHGGLHIACNLQGSPQEELARRFLEADCVKYSCHMHIVYHSNSFEMIEFRQLFAEVQCFAMAVTQRMTMGPGG